jgi:6-phosphogluconate dehydrogenase
LRTTYRRLPGGTSMPLRAHERERFTAQVEQALYASKVIAYDQGWIMIRDVASEYDWNIDLGSIAAIWRGGCIIRAAFLDRIRAAYTTDSGLPSLLSEEQFAKEIAAAQVPWRGVVASATHRGIPAPAFSAALSYYDTLRAERLPAALIQGQRDFFGAHTYQRTDRESSFHTLWAEPGQPEVKS